MTKLFIYLLVFAPFLVSAQKIGFKGSLWENGRESECNWYFNGNRACMEFNYLDDQQQAINVRLVMDATTQKMQIVTTTPQGEVCHQFPVDSIKGSASTVQLVGSTTTGSLGAYSTQKWQGRTHEFQYLSFTIQDEKVKLSAFLNFLKNDEIFRFFAVQNQNRFPVQVVKTNALGELLRSYVVNEVLTDFSDSKLSFSSSCE